MRLPTLALAFLLLPFVLHSQSKIVPIESINVIASFEAGEDCDLSLTLSDDKLILLNNLQKDKFYISKVDDLNFKEHSNPFLIDNSFILKGEDVYGFRDKKFLKVKDGKERVWNKSAQNSISRSAIKSRDNTILLLKTGLLGSELERLDSAGNTKGKLNLQSNQICSFRIAYHDLLESNDGSLFLLGNGLDQNPNDKSLIVTKLDSELNKIWDQKIEAISSELVIDFELDKEENLRIVTRGKRLKCKYSNHRFLSISQSGEVLNDKCLQFSFDNSALEFGNGFLIHNLERSKNNSATFSYYDASGKFKFSFTLPFTTISDFELSRETLIFSSGTKVYAMDFDTDNEDIVKKFEFSIYPNPSHDVINIKWGNAKTVNIYSSLGVLIEQVSLKNGIGVLSIQAYPEGIYYISDVSGLEFKKFVKTNFY